MVLLNFFKPKKIKETWAESRFEGKDIKEVWNFRLSKAVPVIDRGSGTWVVHIYSKDNPDYRQGQAKTEAKPLESFDTEIPVVEGDTYDTSKIIPCYEWLLSVRDKYALDNIEELKPHVKTIEVANKTLSELGAH